MAKLKSNKKKKKASASLPWGWIVLGIIFVVVLIVGMMGVNAWTAPGRELQAEIDRIRSDNEPASVAEAEAWFQKMPGDPNLGQSLLKTGQELRFLRTDSSVQTIPVVGAKSTMPTVTGPWPELPSAEALMQRCYPQINRLVTGAKQTGYARLPVSFQPQSQGMPAETVMDFRAMARLLHLRALTQAHRKDWAGVAESLESMLAVVHQIEQAPDMILQLIRCAIHGVATNLVGEMAPHAQWSADDLNRLEQALLRIRFDQSFRNAYLADRAIAIDGLRNPGTWSAAQGGPLKSVKQAYTSDQLWYLQRSRRMIEASNGDLSKLLEATQQDEAELVQRRQGGDAAAFRYYCTMMAFPAAKSVTDAQVRSTTRNQAAVGVIHLLRYRLTNNQLPTSPDQLTALPGFPRDPLTNAPLKVNLNQNEWVLYGVGPDRKDDGGAVDQPPGTPVDVGYRVRL